MILEPKRIDDLVVYPDGRIWSLLSNKFLKPHFARYYRITIGAKPQKCFSVHRLVALAFVDNPKNKPQVNHIDLDRKNNHYSNLEWVTPKENTVHFHKSGLAKILKGENHPSNKLSEKDVLLIRELRESGHSGYKIASWFGLAPGTVYKIEHKRRWSHI